MGVGRGPDACYHQRHRTSEARMPTHATHPSAEDLTAFDAGALPAGAHAAVEQHVTGCDACCRFLERLPENPLGARLRESARAATVGGAETDRTGHAPPVALPPTALPEELSRHSQFEVLELVGAGATGAVYRATQRPLDR